MGGGHVRVPRGERRLQLDGGEVAAGALVAADAEREEAQLLHLLLGQRAAVGDVPEMAEDVPAAVGGRRGVVRFPTA